MILATGKVLFFFFFLSRSRIVWSAAHLWYLLHGFSSQIMPKNHWYCSTSECVVISMLMSGYAVKQSNYWMMATVRQLPYWMRVQLMSAEQLEYWHWVNEHFGKLRLTETKKKKKKKGLSPLRIRTTEKGWAHVEGLLYYTACLSFHFLVFVFSCKAAGQRVRKDIIQSAARP